MDANTGSSQNFYSVTTGIAFALFAASRGIETLNLFRGRDEDVRHLRAVSIHAGLAMVAALLPLALSDRADNTTLCSYVIMILGLLAYAAVLIELQRGHIRFLFKKTSATLFGAAAACVLMMGVNAIWLHSSDWYKALVLCTLFILCIRFYLVVGVVVHSRSS